MQIFFSIFSSSGAQGSSALELGCQPRFIPIAESNDMFLRYETIRKRKFKFNFIFGVVFACNWLFLSRNSEYISLQFDGKELLFQIDPWKSEERALCILLWLTEPRNYWVALYIKMFRTCARTHRRTSHRHRFVVFHFYIVHLYKPLFKTASALKIRYAFKLVTEHWLQTAFHFSIIFCFARKKNVCVLERTSHLLHLYSKILLASDLSQ